VLARASCVVLLLLAGPFVESSPVRVPDSRYWVQAAPQDEREAALQALAIPQRVLLPPEAAALLAGFTHQHPQSTESGLAQLAAGLVLAGSDRHLEAIPHLTHPDVARTPVADHALQALARSYEKTGQYQLAAARYRDIVQTTPNKALLCTALLRGGEVNTLVGEDGDARRMLESAISKCPGREPEALLHLAAAAEKKGDWKAAATALDRLDTEYPTSAQAREAVARLRTMAAYLPLLSAEDRNARDLRKAHALYDATQFAQAVPLLRSLTLRKLGPEEADRVRVRLGHALLRIGRDKEARAQLVILGPESAYAPEAAYHLATLQVSKANPFPYEAVVTRFPNNPWAEEALLSLAHHYQKDGRDKEALPYFIRIYEQFPTGRLIDRATWRVGWSEYKQGRFEQAAAIYEKAARDRPKTSYTGAFLYWTARARRELGQEEEARKLFQETADRYKYAYHGVIARQALGRLPGGSSSTHPTDEPTEALGEPFRTRVRSLLLVDRFEEALEELRGAPVTAQAQATGAWIQWRLGRLRPAITGMKRAYPAWATERGDELPDAVWRILYPIQYAEALTLRAAQRGLDPALVAALICQESTFDASSVSAVGARGLMQLMPRTGRELAGRTGLKYRIDLLHDPQAGLDLGVLYLKQMIASFGGRVERSVAAYNAGPHRVSIWVAGRRDMSAEEFVDNIPYPETRLYVMTILAAREQYRRIYGLPHGSALKLVAQNGVPPELALVNAPDPPFRADPKPEAKVAKASGAGRKGKAASRGAGSGRKTAAKKPAGSGARKAKAPAGRSGTTVRKRSR
jgi:soluble lytic murein transglycosylase